MPPASRFPEFGHYHMIFNKIAFRAPFAVCLLMLGFAVKAQTTHVNGTVTNEEGEALPYVNVFFAGTTKGTVTDFDGKYHVKTTKKIDSIAFSAVGYQYLAVKINRGQQQEVNAILKSGDFKLEEIVVKRKRRRRVPKDTLAIRLYRNVIKNKDKNRPAAFDYLSYEEYTKMQFDLFNISDKFKESKLIKPFSFALENLDTTRDGKEFLPALLKESITEVYYRKDPKARKEKLLADRFSGIKNNSISKFIDYQFDEVNIYDNLVIVGGKSFVSPFAAGANISYRYYLKDSTFIDNQWCYKLDFIGKGKQSLTFLGHAWVHDTTYAVRSVEMLVLDRANLNFIDDFEVRQSFTLMPDGNWFKTGETVGTKLKINKKKEDKGSLRITKTTSRSKVKINEPVHKDIFRGELQEVASDYQNKDESFWQGARHDSLTNKERNIYTIVDSVQSTPAYRRYRWLGKFFTSAQIDLGKVEIGRFYKFFSWNDIEGIRLRLGGRTNLKFSERLQFNAYGAYGFKDEKFKYHGQTNYILKRKHNRWHKISATYSEDYARLGQTHELLTHDNLVLSIFSFKNPLDKLLFVKKAHFLYEREWVKGFSNNMGFAHRRFYAVPDAFDFSTIGDVNDTLAVEKFTATEFSLQTRWGHKEPFYEYDFIRVPILANPYPVFTLDYTAGIKGFLKGDYNYHKLDFSMRHRLSHRLGYTRYNIYAGKVFGTAPYPLLRVHPGNESFLNNLNAYALMNEFEYISDEYAALWIAHHFDGLIMNKIPGINKLKIRSFVIARGLIGRVSNTNRNVILYPDDAAAPSKGYAEVGFGFEAILKLFRVDFMWRLTQRDKPDIQKWGIKFYIQPKF